MTGTAFPNHILAGVTIGIVIGFLVGILTLISDAIFYSRYVTDFRLAKKYSNPSVQLLLFLLVSISYGGLQGAIFAWLLPVLPMDWLIRGAVFGGVSYLVLSRHFVEGFAFMSPAYFPVRLSSYLSIEFIIIYVLMGILISAGMLLLQGV